MVNTAAVRGAGSLAVGGLAVSGCQGSQSAPARPLTDAVRLEDDMHSTENGAELFPPASPSLEAPFARS